MITNRYIVVLFFILTSALGCDLQRHGKCEWYLEPEPAHIRLVEKGWVSICARNYENKREKCYLMMPIDQAESVYGKKVTYSSLELGKGVMKEIKSYKTCE